MTVTDAQAGYLLAFVVGALLGMALQNFLDCYRLAQEEKEEAEEAARRPIRPQTLMRGRRKPFAEMTGHELMHEAVRLDGLWAEFTALADDDDYPGHAGSPGESLHEELEACQHELKRRGLSWPFAGGAA